MSEFDSEFASEFDTVSEFSTEFDSEFDVNWLARVSVDPMALLPTRTVLTTMTVQPTEEG